MKICAVICEYDPFHNGHAYQLDRIKADGYAVLAVMSGSFTQRGTAATLPKYYRAEAALCGGADLVLELPFPYCASGAANFAGGAVSLIESLSCADALSFGSECGDTGEIIRAAKNTLSEEFQSAIGKTSGERYAGSYCAAYEKMFGKSPVFSGSNDLLAFEYVKSLIKLGSGITPIAIKRAGQKFSDVSGEGFPSALSVRDMIKRRDYSSIEKSVPSSSAAILRRAEKLGLIADTDRLFPAYAAFFRLAEPAALSRFAEMNEELSARLCASSKSAASLKELLASAKTKLYSDSRLRRAMLFSVLGVSPENFSSPDFTVLLAANATGRKMLDIIHRNSSVSVVTKPADYAKSESAAKGFPLLLRAESLWTLATEKPQSASYNMYSSPYISEEQ